MALSHERAFTLSKIINADKDRAKTLLGLEPYEAAIQINALGHDFTIDEIREYGKAIRNYIGGHMRKCELDCVTGGVMVEVALFNLSVDLSGLSIDRLRW